MASIKSFFPAMYPPCTPNAFANVPLIISTSILSLSVIPPPVSPYKPTACTSSKNVIALYLLAILMIFLSST